jgi:hypothetical protein
MPPGALDVVLASANRISQDLPGRVDALHLGVIAGDIRMEDLGEDAVGGLDHERVRLGVHLQGAVVVGT